MNNQSFSGAITFDAAPQPTDSPAACPPVYAGFVRRAIAFFIDQLVILFFLYLTGWGAFSLNRILQGPDASPLRITLGLMLFCVAFPFTYFVYFHANGGQTPGKKALGIKVVEQSGAEANWGQALLRSVGYIFSSMFFMLGFWWSAFDRRSQALHDKIAGTVVLEI